MHFGLRILKAMSLAHHPGFVKLQADFYGKDKEKDDFALTLEPVELLSAGNVVVSQL